VTHAPKGAVNDNAGGKSGEKQKGDSTMTKALTAIVMAYYLVFATMTVNHVARLTNEIQTVTDWEEMTPTQPEVAR